MAKFQQNLPASYKRFETKFKANFDRLKNSQETIFESSLANLEVSPKMIQEHYNYFVRNHLDEYNSTGRDQTIITKSIYESFNQTLFNLALDSVITEGSISWSNQVLLENTVEKCNVKLENVGKSYLYEDPIIKEDKNKELQSIQENTYGAMAGLAAGVGAKVLGAAAGPIGLGVGIAVSLATSLLASSKHMNDLNNFVNSIGGFALRAITGHIDFLGSYMGSAQVSKDNLIKFDNIDADPAVIKLFTKMQRTTSTNAKNAQNDAKTGLSVVVAECIEQNKSVFDIADTGVANSFFANPKNYNLFKLFWKSTLGNANTDKKEHDILLRFRKCLATKLVDVYKLLLISNLQSRSDHKRILDSLSKVQNRPEAILQFIPKEAPEDEKLQDAILALVQFRIHLWNLSKDLNNGMFDVDREAGKFLQQKLSTVDSEVESYLRLNRHKWAPKEENPNAPKRSFEKRSFLSNRSNLG